MLGDNSFAKRVNRTYVGGVEQEQLVFQAVVASLPELFVQSFGDTGSHLVGGGVCKGQYEYLGNVGGIFSIGEEVYASFGKYGCFSGSG